MITTPNKDSVEPSSFSGGCAYVNGAFVPIAEASVPLTDWGFIRSDATYDVVSVRDGAFFRLNDHVERFYASAAKMRLTCPASRDELIAILNACVAKAGLREAYVSFSVTRGRNLKGTRDPRDCVNALYAYAIPYFSILPWAQSEQGLSIEIVSVVRRPDDSFDSRIKSYQWGDFMIGVFEAYDKGAQFPLLCSASGHVTEGPGYNFFALIDGAWHTSRSGVLEGITRLTAVELIKAEGGTVFQTDLPRGEVLHAAEAFISSTAGGIMPVSRINETRLPSASPGSATQTLRSRYEALVHHHDYCVPVDYVGAIKQ